MKSRTRNRVQSLSKTCLAFKVHLHYKCGATYISKHFFMDGCTVNAESPTINCDLLRNILGQIFQPSLHFPEFLSESCCSRVRSLLMQILEPAGFTLFCLSKMPINQAEMSSFYGR